MPGPRAHAPFAARLLAFALLTSTLVGAAIQPLHHRFLTTAAEADWARREELFSALEAAYAGQQLLELLLLALVLIGALRYGRDIGDRRAHGLALAAGACLALHSGLLLSFRLVGDSPSLVQTWWLGDLMFHGVGLIVLALAVARGERSRLGRAPTWAPIAAALLGAATLATLAGAGSELDLAWLTLPGLLWTAGALVLVGGLVAHAERLRDGTPLHAWARAAIGLDNYRDATALRVLLMLVVIAGFLPLARASNFQPRVLLGMLCLFGLTGVVLGVVQICGLVRLADAPTSRRALALALPLLGLGLAGECLALAPTLGLVLAGTPDPRQLQRLALPEIGLATQGLALIALVALLLALRGLARARGAAPLVRRCTTLIVAVLALMLVVGGLVGFIETIEARRPDPPAILAVGASLLAAAVWLALAYFRVLARVRDAMRREPA